MMPLTFQEDEVKNMLIDEHFPFESHHVFELPSSSAQLGFSVDFLVFLGPGVVLECTSCSKARGWAISELRRRSAFMDYRFGLLRALHPNLVFGAVVDAQREDQQRLEDQLKPILRNSHFLARSTEELRVELHNILGGRR
jgi:hypothetical protein